MHINNNIYGTTPEIYLLLLMTVLCKGYHSQIYSAWFLRSSLRGREGKSKHISNFLVVTYLKINHKSDADFRTVSQLLKKKTKQLTGLHRDHVLPLAKSQL